MDNNSSKRFKKNYPTTIDKINEMIEYPKLYLTDYFDTAKAKVDSDFVAKLSQIKDDSDLRDKTNKKWIQMIEIIEKCEAKCSENKLNDALIEKVRCQLENSGAFEEEVRLVKLLDNLESHLLENDSLVVIVINIDETSCIEDNQM